MSYVISNPLLAYKATDVTAKNKVRATRIVLNLFLITISKKNYTKKGKSKNYRILIILRERIRVKYQLLRSKEVQIIGNISTEKCIESPVKLPVAAKNGKCHR